MRLLVAIIALAILGSSAHAADMKSCAAQWTAMKKAHTTGSQTYQQFATTCMAAGSPGVAPAPANKPADHPTISASAGPAPAMSGAAPSGATAQCKDGTYSMSAHHSGTCSRHGGVAKFFK